MHRDTPDPNDRSLTTDDRAVSEILGAILIFGLLIAVLVLVQVNAVPAANQQVEAEHNNRVIQDFENLQETLYRTGSTGSGGAVTVETGVSYPPRFFLLNPGPTVGSLSTTGQQPVTISGAVATGETGDYWNGDPVSYSSTGIAYNPSYNEVRNPGNLRWENGLMYSRFENDATLFNNPSGFVDGRNVRLTLLEGQVGANALSTVVDVAPVSTRQRTVSLTNTTDPIEITVGTELSAAEWAETLETEPFASVAGSDPAGTVTIQLEPGITYDLTIAKLRVGSTSAPSPPATYLTDVSGDGVTLGQGASQRLVLEARDEFNNPVSGTPIEFSVISGPGTVSAVDDDRTNNDGRLALRYDAPNNVNSNRPVTVEAKIDGTTSEWERVTFDLLVLDSHSSGDSETDGVSRINPGEGSVRLSGTGTVSGSNTDFTFTFTNAGTETKEFDEMRLLFATQNDQSSPLTEIRVTGYTKNGVETLLPEEQELRYYEEFVDITNIRIDPDESVTISFTSDKRGISGDMVAISVRFDEGTVHNYFGRIG